MVSAYRYGSRPQITVDGAPLSREIAPALISTVIDLSLDLPDMFVLTFHDTQRDVATRGGLRFGSQVVVSATPDGGGTPNPIITGEITSFEQQVDDTGAHTVVRGYDASHRLCRGRRTRTFTDVRDADIVRRIAQDAGIALGHVDDDGPVRKHVGQTSVTDLDFLHRLAAQTGHAVRVAPDGKLEWRTLTKSDSAPGVNHQLYGQAQPRQLRLGRELIRFSAQVTAARQVAEVHVRGWDPQNKAPIVGMAAVSTAGAAQVGVSPAELAQAFAAPPLHVVDRTVSDQDEADRMAAAIADGIASSHVSCDGTCYGDPTLVPATAVSIGGVGWPHDGTYVLRTVRHTYDNRGFLTDFTVADTPDGPILGHASHGATIASYRGSGPPIYGLVVGQVTDIQDPENGFRVKVKFPWLADDFDSWWCRVAQPGAGAKRGLIWLPEVDDEVLVGFYHGDVGEPYVIGSLYNGKDAAPFADQLVDGSNGSVRQRGLVSRGNRRLLFSDDDSKPGITMQSGDDNLTLTFDESATAITVDSKGTVTIQGSGEVKISTDSNLTLSANSNVSVEAKGSLSLKGNGGVTVDAGASTAKVSGSMIQLN